MSPSGQDLTCLFPVGSPGPFVWGPLGDRLLLDTLHVKGIPGAPTRSAGPDEPLDAA